MAISISIYIFKKWLKCSKRHLKKVYKQIKFEFIYWALITLHMARMSLIIQQNSSTFQFKFLPEEKHLNLEHISCNFSKNPWIGPRFDLKYFFAFPDWVSVGLSWAFFFMKKWRESEKESRAEGEQMRLTLRLKGRIFCEGGRFVPLSLPMCSSNKLMFSLSYSLNLGIKTFTFSLEK